MTDEELLAELRAAFPPEPIAAWDAFDQRGRTYCDGPAYRAHIDGKTWEQLDATYVARRSDALSFMSDGTMRAVLPMYLYLFITLPPTSAVYDTLMPMLTQPDPFDPHLVEFAWRDMWFRLLVAWLTEAQERLIVKILHLFVERHPNYTKWVQVALDRYWTPRIALRDNKVAYIRDLAKWLPMA